MTQQEPGAGRPPRSVWDRELPWQAATLGNAGELRDAGEPRNSGEPRDAGEPGTGERPAVPGPSDPHDPADPDHEVDADADAGFDDEFVAEFEEEFEEEQEEPAAGRTDPTNRLLAAATGLCVLLLVVPALLLDGSGKPGHSDAGSPAEEQVLQQPSPATGSSPPPAVRPAPEPSPSASRSPGATRTTAAARVERVAESAGPTASFPADTARTATAPGGPAAARRGTATAVAGTSVLRRGESWSADRVVLAFQGDGNLVLYDRRGRALWSSGTVGRGARTVFQADGNLVVYTEDMRTAWSSRTDGHDGAELLLRGDDLAVRYGDSVLWSTATAP
ncbi:hypothetical protein [Streptomyces ziwulingensis]|uniref:Bulb-type lectin domain-containing protein n=1 Tax=Streptomyces ziwulingensis TaxID=1045501 RepID=A0ABP9C9J2_9ACTN